MNCHHHTSNEALYTQFMYSISGINEIDLIIAFFILGVTNSFTHCISMCGPIAVSQVSMRLMHIENQKIHSQLSRIYAGLAPTYYIGKAMTYSIMGATLSLFSELITQNYSWQIFRIIVLLFLAILFSLLAFTKIFSKFKKYSIFHIQILSKIIKQNYFSKYTKQFTTRLSNLIKKLHLKPEGFHGLLLGMILGLIPCGLVYMVLLGALSTTSSPLLASMLMFVFGLGTFPGLFLVSYFGTSIIQKYKTAFGLMYAITMLINAYIFLRYAISLID